MTKGRSGTGSPATISIMGSPWRRVEREWRHTGNGAAKIWFSSPWRSRPTNSPRSPHWTARLEYLFTDYGNRTVAFANNAQLFTSDFKLNQILAGVSYHFGEVASDTKYVAPGIPDADIVNFHGQTTFTWQGYPAIRSPYSGPTAYLGAARGARLPTPRFMPACGCGRALSFGSILKSIKVSA
jgi:hypothetical protein